MKICYHPVSSHPGDWISKFRWRSAAFTNSDWQFDSCTHTYNNANSNDGRYSDTNTCRHSAPAVWPAASPCRSVDPPPHFVA
jgi:hypothetical protein